MSDFLRLHCTACGEEIVFVEETTGHGRSRRLRAVCQACGREHPDVSPTGGKPSPRPVGDDSS